MDKIILDACCGGRMFWFNKHHPNTIYIDNRVCGKGHRKHRPNHEVKPDIVMDFRDLKFEDNTFRLVVFDPPHLYSLSKTSTLRGSYGVLNKETWREDIKRGFDECMRVLENYGILIFKWNEAEIKKKEILSIIKTQPLFGHLSGSKVNTHWLCFMKLPAE